MKVVTVFMFVAALMIFNSNSIAAEEITPEMMASEEDNDQRILNGEVIIRIFDKDLSGGNLEVLQGVWEMAAVDQGRATIVSHEIRIQPSFPAPRWLIRRSLNKDLPDMLACIRGLAHASGEQAQEQADLQRCPGDVDSLSK